MPDLGALEQFFLEAFIYPIAIYANHIFENGAGRFFWGAILVGLVVYVCVKRALPKELFVREVWLSPSAKIDYLIAIITPLSLIWFAAHIVDISAVGIEWSEAAANWLGQYIAPLTSGEPHIMAGAALTLILFIASDFRHWFVHYLSHKVPALWALHKVHHSAETLNFVTAERFHPLETLFGTLVNVGFVVIVNIIFLTLFGPIDAMTLVGANIIGFALNLLGGTLRHSPIYFSYGPFWERYLISPAMHQIHHSISPRHFDKNFGGALSIWDRLFGTHHYAHDDSIESVGLGTESSQYHSLWGAYGLPLTQIGHMSWRSLKQVLEQLQAKKNQLFDG